MQSNKQYSTLLNILLVLITAIILACSNNSVAGGGGATSEGTNAFVVFTVATASSQNKQYEYAFVPADLNPVDYNEQVKVGITNSNGVGEIELPDGKAWSLEIIDSTVGFHKTFFVNANVRNDLGIVELGEFSTLQGSVDLSEISHGIDTVYLAGSHYSTTLDENGNFVFADIPPGDWELVASKVDDPIELFVDENESINLVQVNEPDGNYDYELIAEVLEKNSNDPSVSVEDVATFETIDGKNVAKVVNLRSLGIAPDSLDGTGLPRMSRINLVELDMSFNGLTTLPRHWGWHFDRIERLDLSDNEIDQLPNSFRDMKTLRYLDLRNNNLQTLPKDLTRLTPDTLMVNWNRLNPDSLPPEVVDWLDMYAEEFWRNNQK